MDGTCLDAADIERLSGGTHRIRLVDIERHPRMPAARKVYLDRFLDVYSGDPRTVRSLIEAGRFIVYTLIAVLTAAQDPARRETWATMGLLKQMMKANGLASGRQIDDIVGRLRAMGFLELAPAAPDRRVRLLKPTETMHAHDRAWLAAHYAPLTVLFPEHDYGHVMRGDPRFQAMHRRMYGAFSALGSAMMNLSPEMMMFFNRAAGYPVIAALLQAATVRADDSAHAVVPYGEVGARFGVSRTHVRQLLVMGEDAGLVKLHARGGQRVEILPRMWSVHDRGMSGGMYFHDVVYVAAAKHYAGTERAAQAMRA